MRVVFSERAYIAVLAETLNKIETETGGVFLGKCIDDVWYIVESIDPGPKSIFEVDYFEYDQKYVQHLINKKALLYNSKLELIGLWHRHPGTFDIFSKTDGGTNTQYAAMREEGAISMLVNLEPEFRFTIYHVAQPCVYKKIVDYDVGDKLFPVKLLEYKDLNILKRKLNGVQTDDSEDFCMEIKKNLNEVMEIILPELIEEYTFKPKKNLLNLVVRKENYSEKIAEGIASDILFLNDHYGIQFYSTSLLNKIVVAEGSGEKKRELIFTHDKREDTLLVTYLGNKFYYEEGLFEKLIRKEL